MTKIRFVVVSFSYPNYYKMVNYAIKTYTYQIVSQLFIGCQTTYSRTDGLACCSLATGLRTLALKGQLTSHWLPDYVLSH